MTDTTRDKIIIMAPELTTALTPELFELYLSDAKIELEQYNLQDPKAEKAQRLLIAHYVTAGKLNANTFETGGGVITKKKLGPLELSYSSSTSATSNNLETTRWLEELNRLLKGLTKSHFTLFS